MFLLRQLAQALRSRGAYQCNMLLGGCYNQEEGPALYWMDYMACMQKMNFGAHGMASNFCLSIFDREWKVGRPSPSLAPVQVADKLCALPLFQPNLTLDEAVKIIQMCIDELKTRFLINQANFKVKVVDKDGVRVLADMQPSH